MGSSRLSSRDATPASDESITPPVTHLLLILLALVGLAFSLAAILYFFRKRRDQGQLLPIHQENSTYHRLTITTNPSGGKSSPSHVHDEKLNLIENSSGPPDSRVPEIRITFPDDEDTPGHKQNGRVVVVRVGEFGNVGLEPVTQDPSLPSYQSTEKGRFESLDLERIGGPQERPSPRRWS
jgi:hypothetical protein